jgi:lon-related putative ATP-dependent protease
VEIVRLAARQQRFLLLVGEPGTGKSMIATALAELLPASSLEDILVLPNATQPMSPLIQRASAGEGTRITAGLRSQRQAVTRVSQYIFRVLFVAAGLVAGYYALTRSQIGYAGIGLAVLLSLIWLRRRISQQAGVAMPRLLISHHPGEPAPFVDATGLHAGGLFGDVRHDPFQSGGVETPPHQLVEPGAIHHAHRGVLFIDEVSTLSAESQQALLTAIQEKQYPITGRSPFSSGAMIRTDPVPCDFTLVLAGSMEDVGGIHPALRSRVRGYGYEILLSAVAPDTPAAHADIERFIAQEVCKDGRIPHFDRGSVETVIAEAARRADTPGFLTTRLRELGGLVRAAGDLAVQAGCQVVQKAHVEAALPLARPLEEQVIDHLPG